MNRFLILIHVFFLAVSLCIRVFLTGPLLQSGTDLSDEQFLLPLTLTFSFYILLVTGVYFATYLVIIIRFYKNLFSDQGYLTQTLPVTTGQHLFTKTLSGCIWGCINMLLIYLSVYMIVGTPYVMDSLRANKVEILTAMGFSTSAANISLWAVILFLIIISFLSVISNLVMYYASIAIGQLVPGHRILGAIAVYFVMNTVLSIVMVILFALTGLLSAQFLPAGEINLADYMMDTFLFSGITTGIITIILYIVTYWIMKKKVNLE